MTKLLLNAGSVPLYTATGAPVAPGGIALSDELDPAHDALVDDGVLVHVKPSDLPDDLEHLTPDAQAHVADLAAAKAKPRGNAERATSDDAGVNQTSDKGGSA